MDPLGAVPVVRECVKLEDLVSWQKTCQISNYKEQSVHTGDLTISEEHEELKYSFREDLNSKIFVWNGDISLLSVQAIVLPVFEVLSRSSPLFTKLLYCGGPRLLQDCQSLTGLRTSEVRVHHGYDLPARYAVHAVEPRYNEKYHSAADTALHICYRSALQICAEKSLRTVAISPLHITRKGFPLGEGTNIALRTIRKCLEMLEAKFDAVIIVTDATVVETYLKFLPVYFPRSRAEQGHMKSLLESVVCNEWGEIVQEERAIRIADFSEIKEKHCEDSLDLEKFSTGSEVTERETTIDQKMAPQTFAQMSGDHDKKRKFMLKYTMNRQNFLARERIYKRLLRIARTENFSRFSALKAIKVSGHDVDGNRVIVIIGRQLNFAELDLEKFLLYLILTFDPVVDEPYTVVYFHTQTTEYNRPSTEYLRKLYNTFDQRYKTNLARVCMVHTNTLTKIVTWIFTSFSASDIRDRFTNVRSVPELYKIVAPDQIDVPPFILSYDTKTNPQAYNTSPRTTPSNSLMQRRSILNRVASGAL